MVKEAGGGFASDPLESALAHLSRGIRADGSYEDVPEGEEAGHQWRLLDEWASSQGLILPAGIRPDREGGREHDVLFDPPNRSWLKFTKPFHAGYAVAIVEAEVFMLPATPLQYLQRWFVSNTLFGDTVELLGLSKVDGWRLVISQPDILGEEPLWEEVETTFTEQLHFRRLDLELGGYEARSYLWGKIGIFDVRPANCVITSTGTVVPIDVIPQYFTAEEARVLRKLIRHQ